MRYVPELIFAVGDVDAGATDASFLATLAVLVDLVVVCDCVVATFVVGAVVFCWTAVVALALLSVEGVETVLPDGAVAVAFAVGAVVSVDVDAFVVALFVVGAVLAAVCAVVDAAGVSVPGNKDSTLSEGCALACLLCS